MRVVLDSRSRPNAESCNATIGVEVNTSDSESTKIVKFLLLDFASYMGVSFVNPNLCNVFFHI